MTGPHIISGFSKLTREEKIETLVRQNRLSGTTRALLDSHMHSDPRLQQLYSEISENNISNYFLPLGLAPNFLINGNLFTVPMVIEESSVVAAASHAAKFWALNGGFSCKVKDMLKVGQVHFTWTGPDAELQRVFRDRKEHMLKRVAPLNRRMEERGGGIVSMEIKGPLEPGSHHYQLFVTFRTADAMGANYINSVLESLAGSLKEAFGESGSAVTPEIVMAILSNYTPECLVTCTAEAPAAAFEGLSSSLSGEAFAEKFAGAVDIAVNDPYRAVTHNKGIFNGMDAVIMATANDYRAVEACGHAYAARDGQYRSLSSATYTGGILRLTLEVPLALGTVGGLTGIHPLAGAALEILGRPGAEQLMEITAAAGLANNFSAVRSLVTTGIQHGHMKMHLTNILRQLEATPAEAAATLSHFQETTISHAAVSEFLDSLRHQSGKT